jgi:hypothetical protein
MPDAPEFENLKNTPPGAPAGRVVGGHTLPEPRPVNVSLQRTAIDLTDDVALWVTIRNSARAMAYQPYSDFMELIMSAQLPTKAGFQGLPTWRAIDSRRNSVPFPGVEPYALLKAATEVFIMATCSTAAFIPTGVGKNGLPNYKMDPRAEDDPQSFERFQDPVHVQDLINEWKAYTDGSIPPGVVPYLSVISQRLGVPVLPGLKDPATGQPDVAGADTLGSTDKYGNFYGILQNKLTRPCFLELIWSYWHEEGMLVQTMNAISFRFQNRRNGGRDPLANLEIDPLRPLNSFLWGWIQDEQHRLSVVRRAYEYDHHYGFTLHGKAVPPPRTADSRSKFVEAFHNLLFTCMKFYNEDDDTTRIADGFPVLNSIREVHILLTEGGHNQYGDLPWTARMEMLMSEWILARPEMREFIGGRPMVAYTEPWMDRVDTMKTLQSWSDTNIMHFRDLGVFGEQILLSIRFGNWNAVIQPQQAANWARYWRAEIQGYIHAYRAVTGVDLTAVPTDAASNGLRFLPPSVHLRQRLAEQQRGRALPRVGPK